MLRRANGQTSSGRTRTCRFERMEPRCLLSADPLMIRLGAVYLEDGSGYDEDPDTIEVTFEGGAPGTQLTQLIVETDKAAYDIDDMYKGLTIGDAFFDILPNDNPGDRGAFRAVDLTFEERVGIDSVNAFLSDGGTTLVINCVGFDAGEILKFSVDLDEVGYDGDNAVVEGNEFGGSILTASFTADHYEPISADAIFHDYYDGNRLDPKLPLPDDNYMPPGNFERPVHTAGAFVSTTQIPKPITISGTVFEDFNRDNEQNNGDPGIEGVPLSLVYEQGGAFVAGTATDKLGHYSFENVLPGNYRIVESQPAGYEDVGASAGTVDGVTLGVVMGTDIVAQVEVFGGEDSIDNDFAEARPAELSGHVYVDADNDGVFDSGETGIGGALVRVQPLPEAGPAPPPYEVYTQPDGYWSVGNLFPGNYRVEEVTPLGYLDGLDAAGTAGGVAHNPNNDLIDGITLVSGQSGENYDFGETIPATLSGYVYRDDNDNGVFDKPELPIEGARLTLLGADGLPTGDVVLSGSDGFYQFVGLMPGIYAVAETQPHGYKDGRDTAGSVGGVADNPGDLIHDIPLKQGTHAENYNFGEMLVASISGRVHADIGIRNCEVDLNEPLLAGVTIYLLNSRGQRIDKTVTDVNGEYYFGDLDPGVYGVEEVQPEGYLDGYDHPGSEGGVVSENDHITSVPLGPGVDAVDYNFCELVPSGISGYVFQDGPAISTGFEQLRQDPADVRDGLFTADDKPIAGVVMQLGDGLGAPILDLQGKPTTTVTNSKGYYEFTMLQPGLYTVLEVHPDGYEDSIDTPGSKGGFAINAHDVLSLSILSTLVVDPKNDAIVRIALGAGETSVFNNFSEVLYAGTPYYPPNPPTPPTPPPTPPALGAPVPSMGYLRPTAPVTIQRLGGGSGGPAGYTWHLSVINGGQPRHVREGFDPTPNPLNPYFDPASWTGANMRQAQWILADASGVTVKRVSFGIAEATPVTGDFNGDGITDVGIFIDGQWLIDLNGNGVWDDGDLWARLGHRDDQPVTGDWDADGKTDIGIYGPAWIGDPRAVEAEPGMPDAQNEPTGRHKNMPPQPGEAAIGWRRMKRTAEGKMRNDLIDHVFHFGTPGDRAVTGDWNGDGVATVGVFRDGVWLLDVDGNGTWSDGDQSVEYGSKGDLPVVGDFNGDGIDDVGIFRDGHWQIDSDGNRRMNASDKVFELGAAGDKPVTGDFDGDGVDQIGIYREAG